MSVTNGTASGPELDRGKQVSLAGSFVQSGWRIGGSLNSNDSDFGDRTMASVFGGVRTGPVAWLAEFNAIRDEVPSAADVDATAGLVEANWLFRKGHNLKATFEFFDPDRDGADDEQTRWSVVWEVTPMQFLQARTGLRFYDSDAAVPVQERNEYFIELHGFF